MNQPHIAIYDANQWEGPKTAGGPIGYKSTESAVAAKRAGDSSNAA
jgi:hypothetical protein